MNLCKRTLDFLLSLLGLLLVAPLMLIIALLIRLESPGPVIFVQPRLGLKGRVFGMYKFRKFPHDIGNAGPSVTVRGDRRLTRIGALLEMAKLDELPQLYNVLKGDMSLVGPRPEVLRFAHLFEGKYQAVLNYMPGLFGPCQVAYRREADLYPSDVDPEEFYCEKLFPQKAALDLQYYGASSCFADLGWIARSIVATITGTMAPDTVKRVVGQRVNRVRVSGNIVHDNNRS